MSKIHKLINKNSNDNLLDNEIPLSKDEKQKILNMTLNKIPTNKNKNFNNKKLLISILIATMMIGTVAMASEYFDSDLDNTFLNFLGIERNNTSLDKAGENINKSVTNNGLNLSVRQTLGDNHTIYIILDVVAPSNIEIPENSIFNDYQVSLAKSSGAGWYFNDLKDENPNDNKQSYLLSYNSSTSLNNNSITLNFTDFGYYSEKDNEFISLVKGNWKLSWEPKYQDISKTFRVNHFVKENNYKSFITSINISPISISVNLLGDSYDNFYINAITLKDGTTYNIDNMDDPFFISGSTTTSFLKSYTNYDFKQIIDVNQVKSVTIGKEVIKLSK